MRGSALSCSAAGVFVAQQIMRETAADSCPAPEGNRPWSRSCPAHQKTTCALPIYVIVLGLGSENGACVLLVLRRHASFSDPKPPGLEPQQPTKPKKPKPKPKKPKSQPRCQTKTKTKTKKTKIPAEMPNQNQNQKIGFFGFASRLGFWFVWFWFWFWFWFGISAGILVFLVLVLVLVWHLGWDFGFFGFGFGFFGFLAFWMLLIFSPWGFLASFAIRIC